MKATAIYDAKGYDNRIALFDDGFYRPCNYYGNGYSKTPLSAEFIEEMESVGYLTDISGTGKGSEALAALNARLERREAAAALGRMGGKAKSEAKKIAAAKREAARRSSTSPLVSPAELRRRIIAFCIADEVAHGRGTLPARTRAEMLTEEALGYRLELVDRLAALPADADRREALRDLIAGHPGAKHERWRWMLMRDPMETP